MRVTDHTHIASMSAHPVNVMVAMTLQQHALRHILMPGTELPLWGWDTTQTTGLATCLSAYLVLKTSYTHICPSSTGQFFPV